MRLWLSHLTDELRASAIANPLTWFLFVLLLIAEYNNYQKGVEIQRICELLGAYDFAVSPSRTDRQEIDNL